MNINIFRRSNATIKKLSGFFGHGELACFLALIAFVLLPLETFAIGQTTDPIVIQNALRGGEYQKTMIVINTEKKDATISFSAEGKIEKWAKFYRVGDSAEVPDILMKPGETRDITVIFSIPQDTPNGVYKGFVSAVKKADAGSALEGSNTSVSQKIDREVTIKVNDKEVLAFDVSVIPKTYDLQNGETLSIRLVYDNQSNISITPEAQIKIKKDGQFVYNTIYPYPENQPAVKPGAIYEIPAIEIPTGNFEAGKYAAELSFLEGDKTAAQKDFGFSVGMFQAAAGAAGEKNLLKGIGSANLLLGGAVIVMAGIAAAYVSRARLKRAEEINKSDGIIQN